MNESMCRVQRGSFVYYTCRRIPVRHAFTTKFGGVSTGACESLNLGFNRGDELENVRENYRLLGETLGVDETRMTLTKQIHDTQVSVVTEDKVGMGLHRPMEWQSDAIVTALADTPIIGFYADCVVTLLYDPATHTAGVCHSGWRGMAAGILPKTVDVMAEQLGTKRESLISCSFFPVVNRLILPAALSKTPIFMYNVTGSRLELQASQLQLFLYFSLLQLL